MYIPASDTHQYYIKFWLLMLQRNFPSLPSVPHIGCFRTTGNNIGEEIDGWMDYPQRTIQLKKSDPNVWWEFYKRSPLALWVWIKWEGCGCSVHLYDTLCSSVQRCSEHMINLSKTSQSSWTPREGTNKLYPWWLSRTSFAAFSFQLLLLPLRITSLTYKKATQNNAVSYATRVALHWGFHLEFRSLWMYVTDSAGPAVKLGVG